MKIDDAYDGKINLRWNPETGDVTHYNIYLSKSEFSDTGSLTAVNQVRDPRSTMFQVTGLETGVRYFVAVSAVGTGGSENRRATAVGIASTAMPRGKADPVFSVDRYRSERTYAGTTIMADNHDLSKPRIIEVNMLGEIIWEYAVPANLREFTNPGFDVEPLPNNNVLMVLPRNGIYEIDRKGTVVWSFRDARVSHDADRLPGGNTLVVWGGGDTINDAQVKEISPAGQVVWSWFARDSFNQAPYKDISNEGWTHTNAALRLTNGNTLISLRNFGFVAEVDAKGQVVRKVGEGLLKYQHDPEVLPNGNILLADHNEPQRALELDGKTGAIVWEFLMPAQLVRDANRLPNGNTLITGSSRILEVTPQGEVVWRFNLDETLDRREAPARGFYKGERIPAGK